MIASADQMRDAACARPKNSALPWIDDAPSPAARGRMATVCAGCPVLALCSWEASTVETTAGFWAGSDRNAPAEPVQGMLPFEVAA